MDKLHKVATIILTTIIGATVSAVFAFFLHTFFEELEDLRHRTERLESILLNETEHGQASDSVPTESGTAPTDQ